MFEFYEGFTPETRRWRTLFHIIYLHVGDGVWARIPGFDTRIAVLIPWEQIAPEIRFKIKVGDRCYGLAAIGAPSFKELYAYINEYPKQFDTELDQAGVLVLPAQSASL